MRLEPLEESGYRLLMDLQASLGDRAAAMTTYHRVAAILEQELGVRPDPATTALLEQLLGTESAGTGGSGRTSGRLLSRLGQPIQREAPVGRE